jgi:hypothetical protein
VAQVSLLRPGFFFANELIPRVARTLVQRNPGLKSETWATHLMLVRASFIFLSGPKAHDSSGRDDKVVTVLEPIFHGKRAMA